jgi:hypothetical protein
MYQLQVDLTKHYPMCALGDSLRTSRSSGSRGIGAPTWSLVQLDNVVRRMKNQNSSTPRRTLQVRAFGQAVVEEEERLLLRQHAEEMEYAGPFHQSTLRWYPVGCIGTCSAPQPCVRNSGRDGGNSRGTTNSIFATVEATANGLLDTTPLHLTPHRDGGLKAG